MSAMPSIAPPSLVHALARYWWLILLRGIVAIAFGVFAFVAPTLTLVALVLFWGAFTLIDGVLALAHAIMGGNMGSRWWLALVGLAGTAAGAITFMMPGLTLLLLLWFIVPTSGAMGTAIVIGAGSIVGAIILLESVRRCWKVSPPAGTLVRALAISAATLVAGLAWPAYGAWIVVKTVVFVAGIVAAFAALGEFSREDVQLARQLLR